MKVKLKLKIIFLILTFFIAASQTYAADKERDLSLVVYVGLPHLLGGEMRYSDIGPFQIGVGMGMIPLNSIIESQVKLDAVPLAGNFGGNAFEIQPRISASFTEVHGFLRWHVFFGTFFIQAGYSIWRLSADVSADLNNTTAGSSLYNAVSGSINLIRPLITPALGWQWTTSFGLVFELFLGASFIRTGKNDVTLGGSVSSLLPLFPDLGTAFDSAQAELKTQVDTQLNEIQSKYNIIPAIQIGLGYEF